MTTVVHVPLCINCKHHTETQVNTSMKTFRIEHKCMRDVAGVLDPVTGEIQQFNVLDCYAERNGPASNKCSKEGRFWEEKKYNANII